MSKTNAKPNRGGKNVAFIIIISLLILVTVAVGIIGWKTDGFRTWGNSFSGSKNKDNFSLLINGKEMSDDTSIPHQHDLRVDVKGVHEYSVEIVPGKDVYFDFMHNGALTKFPYIEGDYNVAFSLTKEDGYFTVDTDTLSIMSILSSIYPDEEISNISAIDKNTAYFLIQVTSGSDVINIPLIGFYSYMEITIDPPEIEF